MDGGPRRDGGSSTSGCPGCGDKGDTMEEADKVVAGASLVHAPIVLRSVPENLLELLDNDYAPVNREGDIVVDTKAKTVRFERPNDAALALAVGTALGVVSAQESSDLLDNALDEIRPIKQED